MSVLSSTNSGANKKLTIELLRSLGWDYPCIIEPIIDYSKLIRDEKHKNECLYIDRRTVGNPQRDYWFYATFYKETDKDCDVNYDITVYPSNLVELSEIGIRQENFIQIHLKHSKIVNFVQLLQ